MSERSPAVGRAQRRFGQATGGQLRLVPPPVDGYRSDFVDLKLSFGELTLIHKSLQAVRTLGELTQDDLLDDTIHLVDLALRSLTH